LRYGKYYKVCDFVCTKENGENITTDTLKYLSRIVNYELGINFNFHSLRHNHATMLLEAGANIKNIQKRLGHSRLATTMDTYSHVTEKMKNDTVNIFESLVAKK
jgi:integrase